MSNSGGMTRRDFIGGTAAGTAGLALGGGLSVLGARAAAGAPPERVYGYGPLVEKGDLALPKGFNYINYKVISRGGQPMSDGNPTPGIFDGMGAFQGESGTTVLIRNHENRRSPGETPVVVP